MSKYTHNLSQAEKHALIFSYNSIQKMFFFKKKKKKAVI